METHLSTQTHTGACEQRRSPSQNQKYKAVGMNALLLCVGERERHANSLGWIEHPFRFPCRVCLHLGLDWISGTTPHLTLSQFTTLN